MEEIDSGEVRSWHRDACRGSANSFLEYRGSGRRWSRRRVDRRVAHELLLVPTSCHNRMVVHIVSTKKDTPVTEEVLGMKAEEGRSGLETFFRRRSCIAALVHNKMDTSSGVRFVGQPDGGERCGHLKSMWLQSTWSQL